jgi:predicted nucleic acid-binding protein
MKMTPNNPTKDDCKIFAAAKLYLETNDPAYLSVTVAKAVARKYGISEQTVFRVVVALHLQGDLRATIAEVYGDALDQPDAHDVGFWYGQVKDMHRRQAGRSD